MAAADHTRSAQTQFLPSPGVLAASRQREERFSRGDTPKGSIFGNEEGSRPDPQGGSKREVGLEHGPYLQPAGALVAALLVAIPSAAQTVERDMFVTVLDRAEKPVLTLGVPDFVVREDGRVREVLRARRATDVIDIALLIDNSQALGRQVNNVREGLEAFIAKMRPQAQISLVALGDRPTIYADYTNSQEQLAKGVGRVFPIQAPARTPSTR